MFCSLIPNYTVFEVNIKLCSEMLNIILIIGILF